MDITTKKHFSIAFYDPNKYKKVIRDDEVKKHIKFRFYWDVLHRIHIRIQNFILLHDIKNINRGGCGVYAECLYKCLNKLGLKPKLITVTRNKKNIKNNLRGNETNLNNYDFVHIMVYVNGYFMDSNGIFYRFNDSTYKLSRGYRYCFGLDINLLSELNNQWGWNTCFNKDKDKPKIERSFSLIEKELSVEFGNLK